MEGIARITDSKTRFNTRKHARSTNFLDLIYKNGVNALDYSLKVVLPYEIEEVYKHGQDCRVGSPSCGSACDRSLLGEWAAGQFNEKDFAEMSGPVADIDKLKQR